MTVGRLDIFQESGQLDGLMRSGLRLCFDEEILRGLENLHEVEATFQGKRFFMRSRLIAQAHQAVSAARVAIPPAVREAA